MFSPHLLRRDAAGRLARPGADLRAGRLARGHRQRHRRHRRHAGAAAHPALRPADRAEQRPGRRDERAGLLRPGLRGARPAAGHRGEAGRGPVPAGAGRLEFRDVHFRYPSADEVSLATLEDVRRPRPHRTRRCCAGVDFTVEPGQMVALVGPSGAGKSTTRMLVSRVYDVTEGAVLVGGVDVRDADARLAARHHRRGHPGLPPVPRDHRGEPAVRPPGRDRRRDVGGAARRPGRRRWSRALPDGLDTVVGERGYRFSGGEKQRIAIARLLLKRPSIVDPRRGHRPPRQRVRGGGAAGAVGRAGRPHRAGDRAPAVHGPRRRPDPGARRGPHRRARHARRAGRAGGLYAELYRTQFADGERRTLGVA